MSVSREQLKREFGLPFYRPHPKQDAFHAAAEYKGRYLRTGNRFGKSDCGAAEDCAWLLGERVWYPKGHPLRTLGLPKHPVKGLLITQDNDKAEEVFLAIADGDRQGKLFRFLPKGFVRYVRKGKFINQIFVDRLDGQGTSMLKIYTEHAYKQNPMGAESSDWDFIHVDEPISEGLWLAVSRGLIDRGGKFWFTCTPLSQPWINNMFVPPVYMRTKIDKPIVNGKLWVITGSIHDNPHLSEEAKEDYLASLPASQRPTREFGDPLAFAGLIYKEFDPQRHILNVSAPHGWDDWLSPPFNYTIRILIDPHPKEPHAVSFWATSPTGQAINYHELFYQTTLTNLSADIKSVLAGRVPYEVLVDPTAWIVNPATGRRWADDFFEAGLPAMPASKQLDYGILKAQTFLSRPDFLYFSPNLAETRWEFDNYTWQENKEKPIDKRDHMMENFYRACMSGLGYVDVSGAPPAWKPTNLSQTADAIRLRKSREMMSFNSPSVRSTRHSRSVRYPA